MSRYLQRRVGQLIMAGFSGSTVPAEVGELSRAFGLGGVILFARNIEAPQQVAELAHDVQMLSDDLPLWVSVDQEGGRVARLREPFTIWPPMQTLGRCGDLTLATRFGEALARELSSVGISLDYAPVLDVNTNADNPVIGDRALSDDAVEVGRIGAAIIEGLQAGGVAACGKHFPGHGDTTVDSHQALPVVDHAPDRLREVELVPFRAAVASDVAMLMTAHVLYPALDDTHPATLSPEIVTGLLRQEIGFAGVIATDDMSMQAIVKDWTVEQATVAAVAAGCDLVLLCEPDAEAQLRALEALIYAVEDGTLPERQIEDALARLRGAKERFLGGAGEWRPPPNRELQAALGPDEHQRLAEEMGQHA